MEPILLHPADSVKELVRQILNRVSPSGSAEFQGHGYTFKKKSGKVAAELVDRGFEVELTYEPILWVNRELVRVDDTTLIEVSRPAT